MSTLASSRKESLEEAAADYYECLTPGATAYLEGRGIDRGVASRFRLGSVVDPHPGHANYVGWLSIPYLTPAGVVALKFRRLNEGTPKYMGPVGQKTHLYNVMALHEDTDTMVVAEGELDALVCSAIVGVPCVGVSGASNWMPHFPRVLEGYRRVLVATDNDYKEDGSNPGRELANRIIGDLKQATLVDLPSGHDINSTVQTHGAQLLRDLLSL